MDVNLEKTLLDIIDSPDIYIKQKIQIGDYILVVLDKKRVIKYGDSSLDRNIYAVNKQGDIVWQIESLGVKQSPKPYTYISLKNGDVIAENWLGVDLLVDVSNGKISPYILGKRPW